MSLDNPSLQDVKERRLSIREQVESLRGEDANLALAEKILERLVKHTVNAPQETAVGGGFNAASFNSHPLNGDNDRALTVEGLIVAAMAHSETPWWTSGKLREHLSAKVGRDIPMGTVGPTLSNMKNRGVIKRVGFRVALAQRVPDVEGEDGDVAIEAVDVPSIAAQ